MILQEIVEAALKDLSRKMRGKGPVSPELVAEFRLLVEAAFRIEDLGRVEELARKLTELENRFNLSRIPAVPADGQQARKTPRLM